MTQSTTGLSGEDSALGSTDVLINLIVTLLAPMFLLGAGGDTSFARIAALETITAYRVQNHVGLLLVAKIVAFGLTALGSPGLSMTDDLSIPLILRLRANANALNRSAERAERMLGETRFTRAAAEPDTDLNEATVLAGVAEVQERAAAARAAVQAAQLSARAESAPSPPPTPVLPPQPAPVLASQPAPNPATAQDQRNRAQWAVAMADVAAECVAEMATLPPAKRREAKLRAAALSSTANSLLCGAPAPRPRPGDLAGMMRPAKR
jgi:hypothetical protein